MNSSIDYLNSLKKFGIRFGLERIKKLLNLLNNPQNSLNIIHVAGTNGKGSVSAIIASILWNAGYKTGLYTSPHLQILNERIIINGKMIPDNRLYEVIETIRDINKGSEITYFELLTAIAFKYFYDEGVDIAIVETGMGGRLDATNVVPSIISIITDISIDHKYYLGNNIKDITREKAEIIKGGFTITSVNKKGALSIIESKCKEVNSKLVLLGRDSKVKRLGPQLFNYYGLYEDYKDLKINLIGDHQIKNAGLSITAIEILKSKGFNINCKAIYDGLGNINWPGRLEIVLDSPKIIIDGAHNPHGIKVLRKAIEKYFPCKNLYLILGIMKDKDIKRMISNILPIATEVILSRLNIDRSFDPIIIKDMIRGYRFKLSDNLKEALDYTLSKANRDDLICVTGSLYTAGEVRDIFRMSPWI
jgi:dihydrofolate synthase/folylpolyglutamate synthase